VPQCRFHQDKSAAPYKGDQNQQQMSFNRAAHLAILSSPLQSRSPAIDCLLAVNALVFAFPASPVLGSFVFLCALCGKAGFPITAITRSSDHPITMGVGFPITGSPVKNRVAQPPSAVGSDLGFPLRS